MRPLAWLGFLLTVVVCGVATVALLYWLWRVLPRDALAVLGLGTIGYHVVTWLLMLAARLVTRGVALLERRAQ